MDMSSMHVFAQSSENCIIAMVKTFRDKKIIGSIKETTIILNSPGSTLY